MDSQCFPVWTVSVSLYGQSVFPCMDSQCFPVWTVSVSLYGQSVFPCMDSECSAVWTVSVRSPELHEGHAAESRFLARLPVLLGVVVRLAIVHRRFPANIERNVQQSAVSG